MTTAIPNSLIIFALIASLGVLGIVIADTIIAIQEAVGAKSLTGQCASFAKNNSARLCPK